MPRQQVSETAIIAAPAARIFALLADPAQHPLIDGTGSVLAVQDGGPERLTLGSKFGMDMKIGAPYKILNTVVEYDQDRLIAWRHFYGHRWRWQLRPLDDGPSGARCEVTETFDWSTARFPLLLTLSPFPRRNRRGIEKSLVRLAHIAAPAGQ
jgi:Polyketide cyclase / dehydrase and lipid transport